MKKSKKYAAILGIILSSPTLTGCGNKDTFDTVKNFNVAVEETDNTISRFIIDRYYDYSGDSVELRTQDGLVILTSTKDTELFRVEGNMVIDTYIEEIIGDTEKTIMNYDEIKGLDVVPKKEDRNKNWIDKELIFNKALLIHNGRAIIFDIKEWRNYEEDDKIQLILPDDTVILRNISEVKLINDESADANSLHNYALTLVGDEEKISYVELGKIKSLAK